MIKKILQEETLVNSSDWILKIRKIYDLILEDIKNGTVKKIMDLGCEQRYIEKMLPQEIIYYPVDYRERGEGTIICDFNQYQFPNIRSDIIIAAGIAYFVRDLPWFIKSIASNCKNKAIIVYTPTEWCDDVELRENVYHWNSHYSFSEFVKIAENSGLILIDFEKTAFANVSSWIFVFSKKEPQNIPNYKLCTGCGLCSNICPSDALIMRENEEGFRSPSFDENKCIQCKKCIGICPPLNINRTRGDSIDIKSYAFWASDSSREHSSSGGAFSLFAEEVLKHGGSVYGAKYNNNLQMVEHIKVDKIEELESICRSKYVQSYFEDIYMEVKKQLEKSDKQILVVGCPCQIAALLQFLGNNYENLFTIDFICDGVPAPGMLKRYIDEFEFQSSIIDIHFRTKYNGWNPTCLEILLEDGTIERRDIGKDSYEKYFHSFMGLRYSCYTCVFAELPHKSDITLGDFWGVQNYDQRWNDDKGTSIVIVNTEKGEKFFEQIKNKAQKYEAVCWKYTITNRIHTNIAERVTMPETRKRFYHWIKRTSFSDAVKRALENYHDIAVISNWSGYNYGAQLTQLAFYTILNYLGYSVIMIERPRLDFVGGNADIPLLFRENPYPPYDICKRFANIDEMRCINSFSDTFIVASDQLWNYAFREKDLFALSFINNKKKKLAYATSFGCYPHNWPQEEFAVESFYLNQFDAISVREDTAVDILRDEANIEAIQVLDPIFLCSAHFYEEIAKKSYINREEPYGLAFILDPTDQKKIILEKIGNIKKIKWICISDAVNMNLKSSNGIKFETNIFIEDLLYYISHSQFVVTDSYHGMCLAIILKKQFLAIRNFNRGATRFDSLTRLLRLEKRVVDENELTEKILKDLITPIDYNALQKLLSNEIYTSMDWLMKNLSREKKYKATPYDILNEKLVRFDQKTSDIYSNIKEKIENINQRLSQSDKVLGEVSKQSVDMCNDLGGQIEGVNQRLNQNDKVIGEVSKQSIDMCNDLGGQIESLRLELKREHSKAEGLYTQINELERKIDSMEQQVCKIKSSIVGRILLKILTGKA